MTTLTASGGAGVDPMECPQEIKDSLMRYVSRRIPTGSFLEAVLTNNLREAVRRADARNILCLPGIVRYCWWELPANCWGSPEAVRQWLDGSQDRLMAPEALVPGPSDAARDERQIDLPLPEVPA